jgi:hypothetical protein
MRPPKWKAPPWSVKPVSSLVRFETAVAVLKKGLEAQSDLLRACFIDPGG